MSDTLKNPNPLPITEPAAPSAAPSAAVADTKPKARGSWLTVVAGVVVTLVLVVVGLGIWWSMQPPKFDVVANARAVLAEGDGTTAALGADQGGGVADETRELVPGSVTVAAAIKVAETLLDKPGGYLKNDLTPPGTVLDNMPSWEYGALTELRDSVRSLRNDFSRSQTQSIENWELKEADSDFNFDADAWFLPSAEEEYRKGAQALRKFLQELVAGSSPSSRFFTRADNLSAYLAVVEKRLGSYGQRLTASVGDEELTAALTSYAGSSPTDNDARQAPAREGTRWDEIDNVFFEARGYSWALLHMMKALSVDFQNVLDDKNAEVSMQQIIRDLEYATMPKLSPIVLNGHGMGLLANHSLVLASYIARANAAVLDLRNLLQRG